MYLCYDVRGIQSFIFRIPKLKYIIGGSALIDRFDRETIRNLKVDGCECLFTGGGKGTFDCKTRDCAESLKLLILAEARNIGVDIRFGISENYDDASKHATDLYPYIPEDLSGEFPCNVSGLYPVKDKGGEHPIVRKRLYDKNADEYKIFRYFENRLLKGEDGLANKLGFSADEVEFFHNVKAVDESGNEDFEGEWGASVLGSRNRWAVVCMDGNDMGSQMTFKMKQLEGDSQKAEKMSKWVKAMSAAIDRCSTEACKAGIEAVYDKWKNTDDNQDCSNGHNLVLPVRPLVVGGDDITVLCHVSYAMDFVKAACQKFNELSKQEDENARREIGESIWPATSGEITISAGVLYCPVSLPLHSAMAYTEALLASAKTGGRKVKATMVAKGETENQPSPASIDWEHITDSVIETPAIYRKRHLYFKDNDIGKMICLTRRPYTIESFDEVEKLAERYRDKGNGKGIPTNIRHKVLGAMSKSQSDRMAFVASVAKNHSHLAEDLMEQEFEIFGKSHSKWIVEGNEMSTSVIDAMQLLEEEKRMQEETVND